MTRRQALFTLCNLLNEGYVEVRYGDLSETTFIDDAICDIFSMTEDDWADGELYVDAIIDAWGDVHLEPVVPYDDFYLDDGFEVR